MKRLNFKNRLNHFTTHNGHGENEGKYFFSTDHLQGWYDGEDREKMESWVPVSFSLPMSVVARPGLEDGIVDTIDKYIFIFHREDQEIPNPDPSYMPDFRR